MKSIADELRLQTLGPVDPAGAEARVVTALRLGDSDVALRSAATGAPEAETRRALQRGVARGRRASRCAER